MSLEAHILYLVNKISQDLSLDMANQVHDALRYEMHLTRAEITREVIRRFVQINWVDDISLLSIQDEEKHAE
jgi:hypothetical protein